MAAIALAAAPTLATACGSHATGAPHGHAIHVIECDFTIHAPRRVPAGDAVLLVSNGGPSEHELLVVRWQAGLLPMSFGQTVVDERALRRSGALVAAVDAVPAHGAGRIRLRLAPGRYLLFCNMAGHYLSGMSAVVEVG
ncbi:MAG TPA: hypothetical protein VMU66_07300 [Gaiellales bacterium]|nr:hypothetical protein [Gaiellales bacterium]